jgi:hypothetical protein
VVFHTAGLEQGGERGNSGSRGFSAFRNPKSQIRDLDFDLMSSHSMGAARAALTQGNTTSWLTHLRTTLTSNGVFSTILVDDQLVDLILCNHEQTLVGFSPTYYTALLTPQQILPFTPLSNFAAGGMDGEEEKGGPLASNSLTNTFKFEVEDLNKTVETQDESDNKSSSLQPSLAADKKSAQSTETKDRGKSINKSSSSQLSAAVDKKSIQPAETPEGHTLV